MHEVDEQPAVSIKIHAVDQVELLGSVNGIMIDIVIGMTVSSYLIN